MDDDGRWFTVIANASIKVERQIAMLDIQAESTSQLAFHPYDDTIIIADSKNKIRYLHLHGE